MPIDSITLVICMAYFRRDRSGESSVDQQQLSWALSYIMGVCGVTSSIEGLKYPVDMICWCAEVRQSHPFVLTSWCVNFERNMQHTQTMPLNTQLWQAM